jgi:hypothetical protein
MLFDKISMPLENVSQQACQYIGYCPKLAPALSRCTDTIFWWVAYWSSILPASVSATVIEVIYSYT